MLSSQHIASNRCRIGQRGKDAFTGVMKRINSTDFPGMILWASTVAYAFALTTGHIVNKLRRT
jgi:hypothetical protein